MGTQEVDWVGILEHETGWNWVDADGSGRGYWLGEIGSDLHALLDVDQDRVTLRLVDNDGRGDVAVVYDGRLEDLADHEEFGRFVQAKPSP